MENIAQNSLNQSAELLKSLAKDHQIPLEIAEQMAILMEQYPDLSLWGSKSELTDKLKRILESVVESSFRNKVIKTE
jgi:hypothetical protein